VTIDERLEKLTERHEALTQSLELLGHRQADAEERQIAAKERHDREMDDIRREERAMRADLRRAFALGVREARHDRRRRQELDEITQLAAAQLVTEEKLQRLIDSMGPGENGNPRVQ
jgi:hypothetical protein